MKRTDGKSVIISLHGDDRPGGTEELEDLSISSCVYEPVLIGLKDKNFESRLEKVFYPQYDREIFIKDADGGSVSLPVEELQFIAFVNRPLPLENLKVNDFTDKVETIRGESFRIHAPEGLDFQIGSYGIISSPVDRYGYIFFANNNIRIRYQQRPIGEILVEKRLLPQEIIRTVLNKQKQLRCLRLGTIIARRARLPHHDIEKALQQARLKHPGSHSIHSGEILIRSGVVAPAVVRESLAIQKKLRNMKLGELFVEMGYIQEDKLYEVLAEKFRRRFINLQRITPADEALNHLSPDTMRKLGILPVFLRKRLLTIATPFPNKRDLIDILREEISCPFEIVVSPHKQIMEALANLPA